MALVCCPECKEVISEYAVACPHCGYPLNKMKTIDENKSDEVEFKSTRQAQDLFESKEIQCTVDINVKETIESKKKKIIILSCLLLLFIPVGAVFLLINLFEKNNQYNSGLEAIETGHFDVAIETFDKLGDYKDSFRQSSKALFEKQRINVENTSIGDIVCFGLYEQDNDLSNGKEEIEWVVLDIIGEEYILITKDAILYEEYGMSYWTESVLRKKLNNTFYNSAFGFYQQNIILESLVEPDDKLDYLDDYDSSSFESSYDKVYVLSVSEVKKYFKSQEDLKCYSSNYVIHKATEDGWESTAQYSINNCCWWGLRSPGMNEEGQTDTRYTNLVRFDGLRSDQTPEQERIFSGVKSIGRHGMFSQPFRPVIKIDVSDFYR